MLVIDASVAVHACLSEPGFEQLEDNRLVAPPLLWSEATSAIHELQWRRTISAELGRIAVERLGEAPIERTRRRLLRDAWAVADQLGWAKTYDAEYVALARAEGCRLLTLDARLQRGARRLIEVIAPGEI